MGKAKVRFGWVGAALLLGTVAAPAGEVLPLEGVGAVFVYPYGTELIQTADGTLWIADRPDARHETNIRNLRRLERPLPHRELRAFRTHRTPRPRLRNFQGLDGAGRRYFLAHERESLTLYWIDRDVLARKVFDGGYGTSHCGRTAPSQLGRLGGDVLLTPGDRAWLVSRDRLWCRRSGHWQSIPLPRPNGADDRHDFLAEGNQNRPYYAHLLVPQGSDAWLVRSMTSNCRIGGSFLVHCSPTRATIALRTPERLITGLVRHGRGVYALLAEKRTGPGGQERFDPVGISRVSIVRRPKPAAAAEIRRRIAELDDPAWKKREAAWKFLASLPREQAPLLREALKKAKKPEKRGRLAEALRAMGKVATEASPAKLAGRHAARLLFVSRDGRQFVQPWADGRPLAELLIADGAEMRRLALPHARFGVDHQGPDGTVYAHGPERLYAIDAETEKIRPILSLGGYAAGHTRIVAAKDGKLCIGRRMKVNWQTKDVLFWVDPGAPAAAAALRGHVVESGLPATSNADVHYPVAAGPDGTLWFVRYRREPNPKRKGVPDPHFLVHTQLWRARAGRAERLTDWMKTSFDPSVWPLADDAAIVMTTAGNDGISGRALYHAGQVHVAKQLGELLKRHEDRLCELVPEGAAFVAGDWHERAWLFRLGNAFYVQEALYERRRSSCGQYRQWRLYRDGSCTRQGRETYAHGQHEHPRLFDRLVGLDGGTGRALAFDPGCKELKWFAVGGKVSGDEVLLARPEPFAWRWWNRTDLPRLEGAWILTPDGVEHWERMRPKRLAEAKAAGRKDAFGRWDARYRSTDFRAVRRWTPEGWRTLDRSLYGGNVFEDAAGCVWHLRIREAEVFLPGGGSQVFRLDAGTPALSRLAVESPKAVWIATQRSLWRLVASTEEKGRARRWRIDRRFSLRNYAFGVAGPWICGDEMYFCAAGRLLHVGLKELLAGGQGKVPSG